MLNKCNGTTMIEVLVTMIIMAVGLLGVMAMQATGLRNNHASYVRSQATILAYDFADRVRANTFGIVDYHTTNAGDLPDITLPNPVPACSTTAGCIPADMAQYDIYEWLQDLDQNLPAGTGTVCVDTTPSDGDPTAFGCDAGPYVAGSLYTIKVWWDENRTGDQTKYKMFYTEFKP